MTGAELSLVGPIASPLPVSYPATEIDVEVVYAEATRAVVKTYRLLSPATLADALRLASADDAFAGVDMGNAVVGIFGRIAEAQQILTEGDRVEIYRPLAADPKNARRARVRREQQNPGRPRLR